MSVQQLQVPEEYRAGSRCTGPDRKSGNHDRPHLSVTQLKMFLRCPLQYEFRYIKGLKIPPTGYITLGKSVHSTLENNYRQKIETRLDLPLEYWKDHFSDNWERRVSETVFTADEKPGRFKDDGIRLIENYHDHIAPNVQPKEVEKEFLVPFEYVKYPLLGYIDLVDENGYIIDHKISKRSWPKGREHTDLQLTAYSIAYRYTEGVTEEGLRLDVMVRNKEPKIQQLYTERRNKDMERFKKLLSYASCSIENGIFYPNENFMCPSCGYTDLCGKW